jgi:hypothetical protein
MSNSTNSSAGMRQALLWALLAIVLAASAWSFYNYYTASHQLAILKDPKLASEVNKKQTAELLNKLKLLLVLPNDKNPVVATINDVEKLATTQDFYRMAHNGDKLIIFTASRKAVIFDEKANKVVNVGPIFFNNADTESRVTNPADKLQIEIRNGTTNTGAATSLRDRLKSNESFSVVRLGKAAKNNYSSTVLVDRTDGSKASLLEALQKELGAIVVKEVPTGEADARNEILIIVGAK